MKDRVDDGKAAGGEQSPADPLNKPRGDEQLNGRGGRAQRGGGYESPHPQGEHAAPAIKVAERSRWQDKRSEGDPETVHPPLQPRAPRTQLTADPPAPQ